MAEANGLDKDFQDEVFMSSDKNKTIKDINVGLKDKISRPRRYKVVMHNDDYTPMEFVVHVLEHVFRKSPAEATRIMLTVHREGIGIAGVYTREIAETKKNKSQSLARDRG